MCFTLIEHQAKRDANVLNVWLYIVKVTRAECHRCWLGSTLYKSGENSATGASTSTSTSTCSCTIGRVENGKNENESMG